jgi:hypothetical protein
MVNGKRVGYIYKQILMKNCRNIPRNTTITSIKKLIFYKRRKNLTTKTLRNHIPNKVDDILSILMSTI